MSEKYISLEDAKLQGLTFFRLKSPCKNGHLCNRYVSCNLCVECVRIKHKNYALKNKSKIQEYYSKNKELRSKQNKNWMLKNKEKRDAYRKEYNAKNREHRRQMSKKWHENNKERARQYRIDRKPLYAVHTRNRYAMKISRGSFTLDQINSLLKKQKSKCANCRNDISKKYHIDHRMPLALGGENTIRNLEILCPTCNLKKNKKHPIDWALENGRLV